MQLEDYLVLARYDTIRFDLLMLDLLDWMAETTKYRSRIDDIFSIFLNVDVSLRFFTSSCYPHYPRRNIPFIFNF